MSINETTIHLKQGTNLTEFESFVNGIEGVQRAMVDIENMNAVIQYDRTILKEEMLGSKIKKYM